MIDSQEQGKGLLREEHIKLGVVDTILLASLGKLLPDRLPGPCTRVLNPPGSWRKEQMLSEER